MVLAIQVSRQMRVTGSEVCLDVRWYDQVLCQVCRKRMMAKEGGRKWSMLTTPALIKWTLIQGFIF